MTIMRPASIWPKVSPVSLVAPRHAEPEHVHRRADILDLETGALAQRRVAAVAADDEIGADLELAVRRLGAHTDDAAVRPRSDRSPPSSCAGRRPDSVLPCAARKSRKSHCGISATNLQCVGRWVKSAMRDGGVADLPAQPRDARMRQLEEFVQQTELVHQLERRGMDGVAAEVAQEIGVLFQHRHRARRRAPAESRASCRPARRRRCNRWF